jgi:hypothetical protein
MEYGLPPPRRIKQRRDRKMVKKQVHTMATAEKVAQGSDWHLPLRTADGEISMATRKQQSAHCVRRRMSSIDMYNNDVGQESAQKFMK